jgi:hypothetical protein
MAEVDLIQIAGRWFGKSRQLLSRLPIHALRTTFACFPRGQFVRLLL